MKLILSEIKNIGKNLAILSYIPSKNCNATVITKVDKAPTVFLNTKPAKHSKIIKNIPNIQIGIEAFIASNISTFSLNI